MRGARATEVQRTLRHLLLVWASELRLPPSAIVYIPTCRPSPPRRRATTAAPAMISRVIRRSKYLRRTAVAAAAPAMISHVIHRSKHLRHTAITVAAPAMISRVIRRSSQLHAPSLALSESRGTTAATAQRRHSSHAPAPSLASAGSRGTLVAMDRR